VLTKQRLRKAAIVAGIALLLLAMMNIGAYYRVVSRAYYVVIVTDSNGAQMVQRKAGPVYLLPWPIPSHFNQPWLLQKLQAWFEPVHQLDRRLRSDVWKDDPPRPFPASPPANWMDQFDRPSFNPNKLPSP
jgi:hypothetical protein